MIGRVVFDEDGDTIDCTKMGVGGKAIPSLVNKITNIRSDAEFVLVVEKDAAFMRLAEDRFYNQYPCIIITGKGQPDVSTRLFLKMVRDALKIPILGLFDSDPYGLKVGVAGGRAAALPPSVRAPRGRCGAPGTHGGRPLTRAVAVCARAACAVVHPQIMSVYMSSSKNMSYDSAALTTSDIKWLGVRPSDLDKYKIPQQCRLEMTANDIAEG